MDAFQLVLTCIAGVHEGLGAPGADGRLLEGQDVGVHGQGRNHAHWCFSVQAPAHYGHRAAERAMSVAFAIVYSDPVRD